MSKLDAALGTSRCALLGYSDPFKYEAGEMNGNRFEAGVSMRVWVAVGDHDVQVLKVKTADVPTISQILATLGRGVEVEIVYADKATPELKSLRAVNPPKAA